MNCFQHEQDATPLIKCTLKICLQRVQIEALIGISPLILEGIRRTQRGHRPKGFATLSSFYHGRKCNTANDSLFQLPAISGPM